MSGLLEQLARASAVAASYQDIWGREHRAGDDTLRALLRAMGLAADDDAAIAASLLARERALWHQVLPPSCVVFDDDVAPTVALRLALPLPRRVLAWSLESEDGAAARDGAFDPSTAAASGHGTVEGEAFLAFDLPLGASLGRGYYVLRLRGEASELAACRLIVAPRACYVPAALAQEGGDGGARLWGAAVQLYSVRGERNWGMGDYTDLATLVDLWGGLGADLVGINPLHAGFLHNPGNASPYSPSSRLFVNVLYLDVEAIEDFAESDAARELVGAADFQARLIRLREEPRVDYAGVERAKRAVLELLYEHFRRAHLAAGDARARAFHDFRAERGGQLRLHALFEALQEHFCRDDASIWGWPVWPEAYRRPDAPAVADFARAHAERVEFFEYLQWQSDVQLATVRARVEELGLAIGLYTDLAVSIDRAGSEAWAHQELYGLAAAVGAPPDDYNLGGQNWGLPPLQPLALRAAAYRPFVLALRASMRHAGALRIDHVMALMRLFWIPEGRGAAEGTYVHYPFEEMLGIVALESHRNRCLVVGEDLGTVPDEVRQKLAAAHVLSYRLLYFERRADGQFLLPGEHLHQAILAASTHDLPTLAGWWAGHDLELRRSLGLFPDAAAYQQQARDRTLDRQRLLHALAQEQLLPERVGTDPASAAAMTPELARAVHVFLARSPAQLLVAQPEDAFGVLEPVNLPGTSDTYPNWRRKLPLPLERWGADPRVSGLACALAHERPRLARAAHGRAAPVIARATYRVQLHGDFTFVDAQALVPYLDGLGVSHLYCSPFLRARPGSRHGYDIVDHNALNPEIGTRAQFDSLVQALRERGMGLLMDVVPNHMGVGSNDNAWWLDVLESGPASPYAECFDIDWEAADPVLAGRVLLPILGEQYGVALERGEIVLEFDAPAGTFSLHYDEHRLPIDPRTYPALLDPSLHAAEGALAKAAVDEVTGLIAAFGRLAPRERSDPESRAERSRDKETLKLRLAQLASAHAPLGAAIAATVQRLSAPPRQGARPSGNEFAELDALIGAQAYRLAYWRVAADEINYRRFFDINELAALRIENPDVFEATHRLVFELLEQGKVDGLRVDHPDGLADPAGYFARLQERYAALVRRPLAPADAAGVPARPLYVVAEKIVAAHEQVPVSWAVYGTTGYRFANVVNGIFVDTDAKSRLDRAWHAFVRDEAVEWEELTYRCRRIVMGSSLAGELTVLAGRLLRLARADRRTRDFTLNFLRQALAEVVANFPVYRTYVVEHPSAQDRRYIDWAVGRARRRSHAADASVFEFIRNVLVGHPLPGAPASLAEGYRAFTRRLQQFTSPVAAKGIEDTALYRHCRLVSLNDVGGDPETFGLSVAAFHGASRDRAQRWPHTMLATSTHDTKRSEDVRARIDVISEQPAAWRLLMRRFSRISRSKKRTVDGRPAPSRNDEYLLYQTLIGSFPADPLDEAGLASYRERVEAYLLKAVREAKQNTGWLNPNEAYEAALQAFVQALLGRREGNLFLDDLREAVPRFAWFGALNSIALVAIKVLSPGVPDFYQGHEAIELSLVDPDNRRPVDYPCRSAWLGQAQSCAASGQRGATLREWTAALADGRAKFWTAYATLQLRRKHERLFADGEYLALDVQGAHARHVVAFARRHGTEVAIVVVPRLCLSLGVALGSLPVGPIWGDTAVSWPVREGVAPLPPLRGFEDVLTGRRHEGASWPLSLAGLLEQWPVVALIGVAQ